MQFKPSVLSIFDEGGLTVYTVLLSQYILLCFIYFSKVELKLLNFNGRYAV